MSSDVVTLTPHTPNIPGFSAQAMMPCMNVDDKIDPTRVRPGLSMCSELNTSSVTVARVVARTVFINSSYANQMESRVIVNTENLKSVVNRLPATAKSAVRIFRLANSERLFFSLYEASTGRSVDQSIPLLHPGDVPQDLMNLPILTDLIYPHFIRVRICPKFFSNVLCTNNRKDFRNKGSKGKGGDKSSDGGSMFTIRLYADKDWSFEKPDQNAYFVMVLQVSSVNATGVEQSIFLPLKNFGSDNESTCIATLDCKPTKGLSLTLDIESSSSGEPYSHAKDSLPDFNMGTDALFNQFVQDTGAAPLPGSIIRRNRNSPLDDTILLSSYVMNFQAAQKALAPYAKTELAQEGTFVHFPIPALGKGSKKDASGGDDFDDDDDDDDDDDGLGGNMQVPYVTRSPAGMTERNTFVQANCILTLDDDVLDTIPLPGDNVEVGSTSDPSAFFEF
jgi:hypothetical protein